MLEILNVGIVTVYVFPYAAGLVEYFVLNPLGVLEFAGICTVGHKDTVIPEAAQHISKEIAEHHPTESVYDKLKQYE